MFGHSESRVHAWTLTRKRKVVIRVVARVMKRILRRDNYLIFGRTGLYAFLDFSYRDRNWKA